MPRNTQPGGKAYPDDSMIYSGPLIIEKENPAAYPTVKTLKTWLSFAGLALKTTLQRGYGFLVNAKEPVIKDKVTLTYNKKSFGFYNDQYTPYYINFSQWFYDGAWRDNEPGWVKISFNKNYMPEDALVIIRLSGYGHMFGGGYFEVEFEGKKIIVPHTAGYNNFQAVTIPLTINKTHLNSKRIKPLGDITIKAPQLGSWRFYDARYDSFLKVFAK